MPAGTQDIPTLIEQLRDGKSPKRRSAAKALRRKKAAKAGPALLRSLADEMADLRAWETQYQMVMALGECGHVEALPMLQEIAGMELKHTMVLVAVGDAVTRLEHLADTPFRSLRGWLNDEIERLRASDTEGRAETETRGLVGRMLSAGRRMSSAANAGPDRNRGPRRPPSASPSGHYGSTDPLVEGGLRAVAMLRLVPDQNFAEAMIQYGSRPENESSRFWVAAACPGWAGDAVDSFLQSCAECTSENTRRAAAAALRKEYLTWPVL